ncbi:nucleotidyltransferase family protein [Paenibacillus sp. JX-17]|uniref:Nucleotidyltransferase family protein n=1 Tax=Paenibacillus lacisoli TaxID=3064525 RepID=A0ABT9C9H0_9BACL|nr:nucleotidyltransferase family protein [Paenibacillus sp. JX-17]MDO7905910.1 nucleotidyltransferase family protein [Paenibacillus sp. JX-17]
MGGYEDQLRSILDQPQVWKDLRLVRKLGLPQACIAAGYVRNKVWDHLHGYLDATPLHDVDVIYYDLADTDEERDWQLDVRLEEHDPGRGWQVRNQARMHEFSGNAPYTSVEDAMSYWPETATAVGIRLNEQDQMEILCPYGLDDLFAMQVRQSPRYRNTVAYRQRVFEKEWLDNWPLLMMS